MIAGKILYYSFLYSGWASAVSVPLTPGEVETIEWFQAKTDVEADWAEPYNPIGPDLLVKYLDQEHERIGNIVNPYLRNHHPDMRELPQALNDALAPLPKLVYLMRYSNLRFLADCKLSWPDEGRGSPLGIINDEYVNKVAAGYHHKMSTPPTEESRRVGYMPYMTDVAVLSSMNESILAVSPPDDLGEMLGRYQITINQVHKLMARLMRKAIVENSYREPITELRDGLEECHKGRIRGFMRPAVIRLFDKLVHLLLTAILIYGDPSKASPKILSDLIRSHPSLRHFLHVNNDGFQWAYREFDGLLLTLNDIVERIRAAYPWVLWVQKLREMVGSLRFLLWGSGP
jgi:hypothetical protein